MRWQTITDPRAINVILQFERRRFLEVLMKETRTVKQLAEELGVGLQAAHHQVKLLEQLGLIEVVRHEARRGRAIKHYRAKSNGFFVPFYATSATTLEDFVEQVMSEVQTVFTTSLTQAGRTLVKDPARAGLRFYSQDNNLIYDISADGEHFDTLKAMLEPQSPAMMSSFIPLQLSFADAKKLQLEMIELLMRYQHLNGSDSYLAHIGLVPNKAGFPV